MEHHIIVKQGGEALEELAKILGKCSQQEPEPEKTTDPSAAATARHAREVYDALRKEGFKDDEALRLLVALMT